MSLEVLQVATAGAFELRPAGGETRILPGMINIVSLTFNSTGELQSPNSTFVIHVLLSLTNKPPLTLEYCLLRSFPALLSNFRSVIDPATPACPYKDSRSGEKLDENANILCPLAS
jgi:hypothetical protein